MTKRRRNSHGPSGSIQTEADSDRLRKVSEAAGAAWEAADSTAVLRRAPEIPTFDVVNSLFHTALLRILSLNALKGGLRQSDFQKPIGRQPIPEVKEFTADAVANVLDKLHLKGVRQALEEVIHKADRNKVFREGSYRIARFQNGSRSLASRNLPFSLSY